MADHPLNANPQPQSCRLVDFEDARVHPGFVPGTWFLTVSGTKPCINMEVRLVPRIYLDCPEYWGIEVVGCLPDGICLTALGPYTVTIPLTGITGSKGIEVFGDNGSEEFEVSGGCKHGLKNPGRYDIEAAE